MLTDKQYGSCWPPPYSILLHSGCTLGEYFHGAQIASKTVGLLRSPWYNLSLGDLGKHLPIMFKNFQVPGKLTNTLAYGPWICIFQININSVISSFTSSGQPDVALESLSTGRFSSDLHSPPHTDTSFNQTVSLVFSFIGHGEFPGRPEGWFEGKAGSSRKSESSTSAGKRSAENRAGLWGRKNNSSPTHVKVLHPEV